MPALVTIWSQNDARWSGNQLGTCSDTIGASGCYITVVAMVISDFMPAGQFMTPDQINHWCIDNKEYVNGCLLPGDDHTVARAAKALAGRDLSVEVLPFPREDWAGQLEYTGEPGVPMQQAIEIAWDEGQVHHTHFMRLAAAWGTPDAGSVLCDDPWVGARRPYSETFGGSNLGLIQKLIRIRDVTPPPPPAPPPPPPAPPQPAGPDLGKIATSLRDLAHQLDGK